MSERPSSRSDLRRGSGEARHEQDLRRSVVELLGALPPAELRRAPSALYLRGDESLLCIRPRVAVIGSRTASRSGLARARTLARELSARGVTVVSGLAAGIDRAAHEAAIEAGGRTIAVLGTPLEVAYPPEHAALQGRIASEHLLVTEFGPGEPVRRGNFPRRDRTMALLSGAVVIVEANETSGALYTAHEALRLGRPVYLLESLVVNPGLTWPAPMIAAGAGVLARPGVGALVKALTNPGAS